MMRIGLAFGIALLLLLAVVAGALGTAIATLASWISSIASMLPGSRRVAYARADHRRARGPRLQLERTTQRANDPAA